MTMASRMNIYSTGLINVNGRIGKNGQAFYMTKGTLKGKFYKTAVMPTMVYESVCWAIFMKIEQRMGVAENIKIDK